MGSSRSRSKTARRRSARSGPARRRGRGGSSARRQGGGALTRAGARVGRHLSSRWSDLLGIGLFVLAGLAALGLWFRSGGPFGKLLLVGAVGLLGPVGYGVPVLAVYWALLLLRGTTSEDRGRMLVGLSIGLLGVLGLASVAGGNPAPLTAS